jgi:hypothetical protein
MTNNSLATEEQLNTLVELEFTYVEGGRWFKTQVTCEEYREILNKGEFDGKFLCAIKVFSVDCEEPIGFIYDFVLKAQNLNPWRLG